MAKVESNNWVVVIVDTDGRTHVYGLLTEEEGRRCVHALGLSRGGLVPQDPTDEENYWNTEDGDGVSLVELKDPWRWVCCPADRRRSPPPPPFTPFKSEMVP